MSNPKECTAQPNECGVNKRHTFAAVKIDYESRCSFVHSLAHSLTFFPMAFYDEIIVLLFIFEFRNGFEPNEKPGYLINVRAQIANQMKDFLLYLLWPFVINFRIVCGMQQRR